MWLPSLARRPWQPEAGGGGRGLLLAALWDAEPSRQDQDFRVLKEMRPQPEKLAQKTEFLRNTESYWSAGTARDG